VYASSAGGAVVVEGDGVAAPVGGVVVSDVPSSAWLTCDRDDEAVDQGRDDCAT
jgi:hypothetical protein